MRRSFVVLTTGVALMTALWGLWERWEQWEHALAEADLCARSLEGCGNPWEGEN